MFGPVSRIAPRLLTRRPATTRTRAADPLRCRPRLESLDGRIVPSVDVWQSTGGTDFTNTANWSLGRLPGFGDDVVFDGGSSAVSCSGLWGMTTYNSFSMVNGYSGTVSVLYGIQAYTVTIASGNLDQGGPTSTC